MTSYTGIDKRIYVCSSGDLEFKLEILGDVARMPHALGPVALLGVHLNDYQGVWTLATSRLSAICPIDPIELPVRFDPAAPMRTELKPSGVRVSSVVELMHDFVFFAFALSR